MNYENRKTNVETLCIKKIDRITRRAYNDLFILHLESLSVSAVSKTFTVPH